MPEVGDMAPDFELKSHLEKDKKVRLSDFRGKKNVVIAFYPLAWTPVWTAQMPAYEADLERFAGYDAQVLGISVDSVPCNAAWAKSLGGLTYDLLSDFHPKGEVAKAYGAWREDGGISERALFIVDKEGRLAYVDIHDISDQPDNEDLFDVLRKLWGSGQPAAHSQQESWVMTVGCRPSTVNFMSLSRKCVPFTPFDGELSRATVAIVTAGGVHLRGQEPFNVSDELGDLNFRTFGGEVDSSELMVTHHHYDHADADSDINVVFPIDVLRDLKSEGFIKDVARKHVGFMGYTMQLKAMYEGTAPQIANEIDRGSRADVVLLTGGWPNVCHRTVVAVQREIEMRGIPTVLITVSPEVSAQMRPPRALYPKGFKVGNSTGRPGMRELQRRVVRDALLLLTENVRPGSCATREYPEYGEQYEPPRVRKLGEG